MTVFFRLMNVGDKQAALTASIDAHNTGNMATDSYTVDPAEFFNVPGAPFAYWVSSAVRTSFVETTLFGENGRLAQRALSTNDDFRYLKLWFEREKNLALRRPASGWLSFAKGGDYSPFYSDIHLLVNWVNEGREIEADAIQKFPYLKGNASWVMHRECNYLHPGLTWPLRTTSDLGMRLLPAGCIFGHKGPAAFVRDDSLEDLLALQSLVYSSAFKYLVGLQLAAADAAARSYEVGVIQKTPVPDLSESDKVELAGLAREAWSLKRTLDTVNENSHAFLLPEALRSRLGDFNPQDMSDRMAVIQDNINWRCFQLYGFSPEDQSAAMQQTSNNQTVKLTAGDDEDDEAQAASIDRTDGLLCWAVGVAFGRFDWRLASGEREPPAEPEPFDPLPAQSPGMLPTGSEPFHAHQGILTDEVGHPDDLPALIERVLHSVDAPVETDLRRWLAKDFFALHLKLYSKSRRQAPIYWPLQTPSGSYTLWVYYHRLSEQTLYTCVNDFVEPKLKTVKDDLTGLRNKTRNSQEEKDFARLLDLEAELKDFRDELLRIAKFWKPNLNDGVQITAAPLWKLFQHKAWQKKLKETWQALEQGDYDWAHLAYSIWPERVLRKCHQDRSLAIAHDVEADFWHEVAVETKRGKKGSGETKLEWQPIPMTDAQLHALIRTKIAGMM